MVKKKNKIKVYYKIKKIKIMYDYYSQFHNILLWILDKVLFLFVLKWILDKRKFQNIL